MKLLLILFTAAISFAQLEMPSIGTMRDASGAWHAVYGIGGNFLLGPEAAEPESIDLDQMLARQGLALSTTSEELVLRRANGNETRFPVGNVAALRAMSTEYVQVSAEGREYVLRLKVGKEALYLLPAVTQ
jgi:hypothetical protein